jgi:hypothetical protein
MLNTYASYHESRRCHHGRVSEVHRWPYKRVSETADLVISPLYVCTVSSGFQKPFILLLVGFWKLFCDITSGFLDPLFRIGLSFRMQYWLSVKSVKLVNVFIEVQKKLLI